jgi:hypothetical protein
LQRLWSQAFESQGLGLASRAAAAEAEKTVVVEEEAAAEASGEHSVDVMVEDNYTEPVAFDSEEHSVDIDSRYSAVEGRSERYVAVAAESEPASWHLDL